VQPHLDTGFFGHPRGLKTLFFAEMWERFSFYGMKAILLLFMLLDVADGGLGFNQAQAGIVLAIYTGLVWFFNLPGGWLADRLLGARRAVFLGGVIIMTGHVCLAFHGLPLFFAGLGCIIIGTGLLKPNMTAMVGQLYALNDPRRESGFSLYYMGINTGSFLAPLVCGFLAQHTAFQQFLMAVGIDPRESWHFGFGAAAVGMFFGLVQYVRSGHLLGDAGLYPTPPASPAAAARQRRVFRIVALSVPAIGAGVAACWWAGLLGQVSLKVWALAVSVLLIGTPAVVFAKLFWFGGFVASERRRLAVVAILFVFSTVFFAALEQGSGTLTDFAAKKTQNSLFGIEFPPTWFSAVNPILIIALSPGFAWLWGRWGERQPSSPAKFTIALFVIAGGYFIMTCPAFLASERGERVSPFWLISLYLFITVAELWISPVGLSMVTKLAPVRCASELMGAWFLANALANFLAGQTVVLNTMLPLTVIFPAIAAVTLAAAVLLAFLVKPIRTLMGGAE
jgi:POT family proton-dependent oligopeptide transporter